MNYEDYILNARVEDTGDLPVLSLVPEGKDTRSKSTKDEEFLIPNLPAVIDQGPLGSCVGCACKIIADMAFKKPMSALWIWKRAKQYDQWAGDDYEGTSIIGAGISLKKEGVCEDSFFPYSFSRHSAAKSGAESSASMHTIPNMFGLRPEDEYTLIQILKSEQPIPVAIFVYSEFYTAKENGYINSEDNYLNTEKRGGHAMAIVGYRRKAGKLYWVLQNSWGLDFGENGKVLISAELLKKISKGSYVISLKEESDHMAWWQRHLPWAFQLAIQFVIDQVKNFVKSRAN